MTDINLSHARKLWLNGNRVMRLAMGGVEVWAQKIKTAVGSLITLTDSLDDPMRSLKVEGKSEQRTLTGKNLISGIESGTYSSNSGKPVPENPFFRNKDVEFIKVSSGEKFRFSIDGVGYSFVVCLYDESKAFIVQDVSSRDNGGVFTSPRTGFLRIRSFQSDFDAWKNGTNFQLEKGSVVTNFEPYCGGLPSPNPEYPQQIHSVKNPVVEVRGKNLLDPDAPTLVGANPAYDYMDIVNDDSKLFMRVFDKDTSVSLDNVSFGFGRNIGTSPLLTKSEFLWVFSRGVLNSNNAENTSYGYRLNQFFCYPRGAMKDIFRRYNIVIATSQDSEFTPYHAPQTRTIPVELHSIGDVKDEWVWNADGSADFVQRIGVATYYEDTPLYTWGINQYANGLTGFYQYLNNGDYAIGRNENSRTLCNLAIHSTSAWGGKAIGADISIGASTGRYWRLCVPNDYLGNPTTNGEAIEAMRQKLIESDFEIVFQKAVVETTHYTPEQVAYMVGSKPELILGTSIIEASSDEVKPEIEVEYYA